jgi:inner membrane protein
MPSPIAHTAMSYVIYRLSPHPKKEDRDGDAAVISRLFLLIAGFSLLPDFDAVLGILFGDLGLYHNKGSHSYLVGIGIALIGAFFMQWFSAQRFTYWFLLIFACYGLHITMDFFTYGRGVMALWPLSTQRYLSPVILFYGLHWSEGLFSIKHIWTLLTEAGFLLLTLLGLRVFDSRHRAVGRKAGSQSTTGNGSGS